MNNTGTFSLHQTPGEHLHHFRVTDEGADFIHVLASCNHAGLLEELCDAAVEV
jgi:hypothetical protein